MSIQSYPMRVMRFSRSRVTLSLMDRVDVTASQAVQGVANGLQLSAIALSVSGLAMLAAFVCGVPA